LHRLDPLTADADLAIDLSTDATTNAVRALTSGGYCSAAHVDPMSLADAEHRPEWQAARGRQVFRFWDPTNTRPTVDVCLRQS